MDALTRTAPGTPVIFAPVLCGIFETPERNASVIARLAVRAEARGDPEYSVIRNETGQTGVGADRGSPSNSHDWATALPGVKSFNPLVLVTVLSHRHLAGAWIASFERLADPYDLASYFNDEGQKPAYYRR